MKTKTTRSEKIGNFFSYIIDEALSFMEGVENTIKPNGYCNGNQEFSKLESVITYVLIATWVLITLGESFGYAQSNVFLTSTVALILGFLFGKNKIQIQG